MINSIVLAAGIGKRMYSSLPKVLHKICGREMVHYSVDAVKSVSSKVIVVISDSIPVEIFTRGEIIAYQKVPLGTGDAAKCGLDLLKEVDKDSLILITTGDNPLVKADDIEKFIEFHKQNKNDVSMISAITENPSGLGRVLKDENSNFMKIIEERDASNSEKSINEVNVGIYIFKKELLEKALQGINRDNSQNEYYLTDALSVLKENGAKIGVLTWEKHLPVYGINNRFELYEATKIIQWEILENLMRNGVSIINPETVNIDYGVEVNKDVLIKPGCIIEGSTKIDSGSEIGPYSRISDSIIGKNTKIQFSVVLSSLIGDECIIGPFSYVRPETILSSKVKIGAFVEVKKSKFNDNSKAPHLSYIGDAVVGKNVNIGAGTITCNFSGLEGEKKNPTLIEDDAFIGSNSTLVAPIVIRKGAYTAAGSVVTEEVPEESLAIGRAKQVNKEGWVKRRKRTNG